jgi:hypothetical protein
MIPELNHVITDFTPKKVIQVSNCWTCDLCRYCKILTNLSEEEKEKLRYGGIHPDCPLDDYEIEINT